MCVVSNHHICVNCCDSSRRKVIHPPYINKSPMDPKENPRCACKISLIPEGKLVKGFILVSLVETLEWNRDRGKNEGRVEWAERELGALPSFLSPSITVLGQILS